VRQPISGPGPWTRNFGGDHCALVDRISSQETARSESAIASDKRNIRCALAEKLFFPAGAFRIAAVLMRSGVGDAQRMIDLGIKVVRNIPRSEESSGPQSLPHLCYADHRAVWGFRHDNTPLVP